MSLTLNDSAVTTLFGIHDENLRLIEDAFHVRISARGSEIFFQGDESNVSTAEKLLQELNELVDRGYQLKKSDLMTAVRILREKPDVNLVDFFAGDSLQPALRKVVTPRNVTQQLYLQAMQEYDITFAIGPAGTGKTFLAVAAAAVALNERVMKRLILCRPAVEAGEKLGFLPGDLAEKINPYLRPLYDSLYDILGFEKVGKLLERGLIEIAPLAYMRGRTLSDAFVILDEAQNATNAQMKMFLTRLGVNSKTVITGDKTQIDLPRREESGLVQIERILPGIDGIGFQYLNDSDVVRHRLVREIIKAYAEDAGV